MEFELHIRWTIDEISQITTLIQNKVNREKSLFDSIKTSTTSVSPDLFNDPTNTPTKKKIPLGSNWRPVDILIWSIESWFALYKSYNTMQAAAQSLGLKEASNIAYYLANDRIYKKTYKFQYRNPK